MNFFTFCDNFARGLINVGQNVFGFVTSPLQNVVSLVLPDWIVGILPGDFLQYTPLDVMFGVGLPSLLVFLVVKSFVK